MKISKNSAVLNDITYPEDIADKVYIKIYDSVNTVDLRNPDPQRSDYTVFFEDPENFDADDIIAMKDIVTYRNPDPRFQQFTPYLTSGETFDLAKIRKLARGIPGDHKYVEIDAKVTVKPIELMDDTDVIAEDFSVQVKFKKGMNEMRFEASDVPLYYRWDKRPGRTQLTLDVRVFPSVNVLRDHVLTTDPRLGYAPVNGEWITNLNGRRFLTEKKVCRREEEMLKQGIDLLIDPYGM